MATITASAYNDSASRTAGESIVISSGAKFTIRTDSRIHVNAPSSMTGSMYNASFTDIGGEYAIDATKVRWLPFNSGSGAFPSIGTSITQGSVSGYFLGIWETYASAPATSVPSSGWIKLREVTGGAFTTGALGGITASATGADDVGWIEIVHDVGANFTVSRVGKFSSRGDWFKLGTTNGSIAQEFQVPSTSAAVTNNYLPGVWVETLSGTNEYEFYPGLNGATNGWAYTHIGQPRGSVDKRCKFVLTEGNGKAIFGQNVDVSATYAEVAAQASAYTNATISSTYTYANNKMIVTTGTTAHLLEDGMTVGLQVTSGDGTTGTYTIIVLDAYNFEVTLAGSGSGGAVTLRAGQTITFTAHGMLEGEQVYCDFTSGTGVDGVYTIWRRTSANAYVINYPSTDAVSAGNVTCYHTVTLTAAAHGLAVGNKVKLNVTSGSGTTGVYTIKTVAAGSFTVNMTHSAAISGNATIEFTLGYVPESGCKVRIPNIFIAECATASRNTNSVPNSTIASRPEITTTSAGDLDLEYIYALSLYTGVIGQAFTCRFYHCAFQDQVNISEIASPLDIDNIGVGMYSAKDARAINFTSCFAGGTIKNIVAMRGGAVGTTDHAFELINCSGTTLTNVRSGIIQFARSTGQACSITTCQNITINGIQVFNGDIIIATTIGLTINDLDYNDRFIGRTNITSPYYAVIASAGCDLIMIDGVTFGLYNTLEDCHPSSGVVSFTACTNSTLRNCGTPASPCSSGTWAVDTYGMAYAIYPAANNNNIRFQKIYVTRLRTGLTYTINSNKNILYDRVLTKYQWINSGTGTPRTIYTTNIADLNATIKGITTGAYPVSAQTSVYGTHWYDMFLGVGSGSLILVMNEETVETEDYVTINSGTNVKFNSAGGIEMRSIGDQVTWEMSYYSKGHTAFANITPIMSGGTIGNYTIEFKIDINNGSGFTANFETLSAANLRNYTITSGFKLQIRITTSSTNTTAITHLRIYTETSASAQNAIDYPLDVSTISFTGLKSGSEIRAYLGTDPATAVVVDGIESSGTTYSFNHSITGTGYIRIFSLGYQPLELPITYSGSDESFLIQQVIDRVYTNPV